MIRYAPFESGRQLQFRGMHWTVLAASGRTVTLRPHIGTIAQLDVLEVVSDSSYYPHLRPDEYSSQDRLFLSKLTTTQRAAILEKEAIVLEVLTGYRSGRADVPAQNEPRPGFDIKTTGLMQRYRKAAEEVGCHSSAIRRMCHRYQKHGLAGLRDGRADGNRQNKWASSPLNDTIISVTSRNVNGSTVSRKVHISKITRAFRDSHPGVELPSERTLYRLLEDADYKHGLSLQAKTRQSRANSPQEMHQPLVASRLGEYVMIDVSPWDILLRGIHHPDEPRRYRMLVATDLYHRGVVGFSLHAGDPQAVDVIYLLYDILNPKHMMPGWPQEMRYPYVGAPESLVLEAYHLGPDVQLTAQGFVTPTNITIDNGAIFKSRQFQDACRRLGITLIISRPYTPTDKSVVERFFKTVEMDFAAHLPGYVGQNAAHRGIDTPIEALMWMDEFQDAFFRYYCEVYLRRPHNGLFHPDFPSRRLSPAEMFEVGLNAGGLIRVPLDADIYYQLLPSIERRVHSYGVEAFGLLYDHPHLNPLRRDNKRHAFHNDPRDLRYLYYRNEQGQWLRLLRKPAQFPHLPFTEGMLRLARSTPESTLRVKPEEANKSLDVIIRDLENVARQRKRSRSEATAAARLDRATVDRERTQAPLPLDPPALPAEVDSKTASSDPEHVIPASFSNVDFVVADDDTDLSEFFND